MDTLCKKENAIKSFSKKRIIILTIADGLVIDKKEKNYFINALETKLQNHYDNMFSRVKISEPLIEFAQMLHFVTPKQLKENKKKYLKLFINISKTLKEENRYYLINYFVNKYYFDDYLLIPNIRFIEEYAFFNSINCYSIELKSYNTSEIDYKQLVISNVKSNEVINTTNFINSTLEEQDKILNSILKKHISFERKKEEKRNPSIFNKKQKRKRITIKNY